jgi:hypothetical protein
MSETREPKIAGKGVIIALGIICIVLVACLGGVVAEYTLLINDKSNAISSLNYQISQLNSTVANLENQVASDNYTINSLASQVANLLKQLYLNTTYAAEGVTTYTAKGVLNGWELTMTIKKTVYNLGEPVNITLTVTNISNQTMDYDWRSPDFDFRVYNNTNNNLYEWSNTQPDLAYEFSIPFNPGESISSGNMVWPQTYNDTPVSEGFPVSLGTYYIVGYSFGPASGVQTNPIQITIV